MSKTPHTFNSRSRTPSRAGTPLPQATSPSRLIPPVLHSAPSLSSLKVYSHAPTPVSVSPPSVGEQFFGTGFESSIPSSAASVANVPLDAPEGILIPEPEVEVEVMQGNVSGYMGDSATGDEEAKKNLREQLRRTLSQKTDHEEGSHRLGKRRDKVVDVGELHSAGAHVHMHDHITPRH
ncbi:hypothetical protein BDW22DRAFT_923141 [Trametopsis cervina]|nr:hypothetical protein BDW22DRAFT_923141 [Trametopsis cervina]